MFLITFLPSDGNFTTVVCLGTESKIFIGLLRTYGPYSIHYLRVLQEGIYLEIDGIFPLFDFRS